MWHWSNHSSCPTRLCRPRLWLWRSRNYNSMKDRLQNGWTLSLTFSHLQPLATLSCRCCLDNCQGNLVKRLHLWQAVSVCDQYNVAIIIAYLLSHNPELDKLGRSSRRRLQWLYQEDKQVISKPSTGRSSSSLLWWSHVCILRLRGLCTRFQGWHSYTLRKIG